MESHVLPDNLMLEQIKIRLTEAGVAVTRRSSACVVKKKYLCGGLGVVAFLPQKSRREWRHSYKLT